MFAITLTFPNILHFREMLYCCVRNERDVREDKQVLVRYTPSIL